ncbi:FagA protein [Roseateles sp. DAIF2]|uniref:FagA protein n=1 Tax=Roseateles sp. DAIF2 TaxID=2714952 RepID=UPI0018A2F83D|nr:FagA protein [Roseateles sp. DAIF2]QPF72430.1 FagA protein [Roseateles sp. DAIF2]
MLQNTPCPAHPALECWRWLAFKIACALEPDSPELLDRYLDAGAQLLRLGLIDERELAEQTLDLLYRSACEVLLPWHWRCQCLDRLFLPLEALARLSGQDPQLQGRVRSLRVRLACTEMLPSEAPPPF